MLMREWRAERSPGASMGMLAADWPMPACLCASGLGVRSLPSSITWLTPHSFMVPCAGVCHMSMEWLGAGVDVIMTVTLCSVVAGSTFLAFALLPLTEPRMRAALDARPSFNKLFCLLCRVASARSRGERRASVMS